MPGPALRRGSLGTVILAFVCVLTEESIEIAPAPYTLQAHRVALDGKDPVSPLRREKRQVQCLLGQYLHPEETHCCMRCHAGTYKVKDCDRPEQAPVCLPCANGTYTAVDNTMSKCFQCTQCRSDFYQIVEAPCTPKQDTVCGCRKNQYQFDVLDRFLCMNCSTCPYGIIANCSKNRNTICRCKPGFFLAEDNICKPCNSCIEEECLHCHSQVTASPTPSAPHGIFFLYIIIAVLGVIVVLCMVNKVVKMVQENGIVSSFYPCVVLSQMNREPASEVEAERNVTSIILPESQQETVLLVNATPLAAPMPQSSHELPDCVSPARKTQLPDNPAILYTVVDHVPPSRWKEFVRRLGLSDYDLERIEMEHRRIRDAQYEMLRLWKLQMGHAATVERISCVLNQMELSGCSEAIQEALPNQNFLQPCSLHSHP
ncbi:tumor necrosis factor receptor superfamily member 1A [Nothoprocta perdicaria]|uniref:tumor necrosis factor receptor superfamily member 1A n=1 Tax=Nothoprocta perdicaria TaxID=30464 RepID=UPI000E1B91EC|nr:tumor necrosis factor receptor superfamily member 1A [Nothoprocta perdicaria]